MKTTALAVCLGAAIFTSGCGQDSSADKRVAELERQVTALQAQNRDTRAKLRAFHAFPTRSPLAFEHSRIRSWASRRLLLRQPWPWRKSRRNPRFRSRDDGRVWIDGSIAQVVGWSILRRNRAGVRFLEQLDRYRLSTLAL